MAAGPPSPSLSALPPIPGSPSYSLASTANPISSFNLPLPPPPRAPHAVLNKSDLESSEAAYTDLLSTAKSYRLALATLSVSASTFGSALEACARLKEARSEAMTPPGGSMSNSFSAKGNCTADNILAASGVHQLIANHHQILSETVYRSFEVPLLHELDQWQRRMEEEEVTYQKEAKAMSREIRRMEKEGLRLHNQRKRDVGKFREHLVQLTMKLDSLTGLSGGHSRGLLRDCQEMSKGIVECSAGLVRAEVDIFEALARKGWTGGGLDELLEKGKDFFASETEVDAHPNHAAKIFSILPQNRSILANEPAEGQHGHGSRPGHLRSDSLLVEGLPYQSLAGAVSGNGGGSGVKDGDAISVWSERDSAMGTSGILNRPRLMRPFSPVPGETLEDPLNDVVVTFLGEDGAGAEDEDAEEGHKAHENHQEIGEPHGERDHGHEEITEEGGNTTHAHDLIPVHVHNDLTHSPHADHPTHTEDDNEEEPQHHTHQHQHVDLAALNHAENEYGHTEHHIYAHAGAAHDEDEAEAARVLGGVDMHDHDDDERMERIWSVTEGVVTP